MKIAVTATVLCLTVVAVAAANQRKGCAERGGECKSVERGDQTTCPGGVRKLDCSGSDRCCLAKGDRNQAGGGKHGNKEEINDKKKKPDGQRSGNARPPSRGEGRGPKKGDRNGGRKADGQGNGNGGDRPRNGRKPNQSPENSRDGKPRNGRKPNQSPENPRDGKPKNGRRPNQSPENSRDGKPRNGRKPNQSPERPKNGRKPNQNDQGGRGDRPRGGKRLNKSGKNPKQGVSEEGSNDKGGEGGEEAGESSDNKPPKRTGNKGGSNRQASCRVKKQCKQLKGKCQSASSTCRGTSYTGNNFCLGSCSCCVKKNQLCRPKNKCKKKNGTCQFKWDSCDGQKLKRACKGSSSACVCCAPRSCKDKNNQCSAAGGSCVLKGATCAGQVDSSLCGKFCQCCLALPPTTTPPSPTTVAPSPTPTTAVPPSPTADPGPQPSTLPPTPEPPSPTGSSGPPTNTATEMHTATAAPPTTTVCNGSRAYCSDCGIANISVADYKVVNGADASQDEYPYQVIVMPTIKGAEYQCGGSIIKKRWILTAAHCFFDHNGNQPNQNAVVVGYGNINQDLTTQVTATKYIVHENYDKTTSANDIALIELPRALDYENDPAIQPICLAVESDIPYGGKAVATGWGTLVYQGTTLPSILQEVTLDIIPISQCKSLTSLPADTTKVVCALTPTKDTCQGDSGGPLVAKVCPNQWVQIGIVSYGVGCAFPNDPGVYTRVSAFRQWIDVNTGSSTSC